MGNHTIGLELDRRAAHHWRRDLGQSAEEQEVDDDGAGQTALCRRGEQPAWKQWRFRLAPGLVRPSEIPCAAGRRERRGCSHPSP